MKLFRPILDTACLALLAVGCVTQKKYEQVVDSFPPLSPGEGRIFFYRESSLHGAGSGAPVELNNQFVGSEWDDFFFYVDRPAGNYVLSSPSGATKKYNISFTLEAGETKYFNFKWKFAAFGLNAEPSLQDKDSAMRVLSRCLYNPNATQRFHDHPPGM